MKAVKKCITCETCLSFLESDETVSKLQKTKSRGLLMNASETVIAICKTGEKTFRVLSSTKNIFQTKLLLETLIHHAFRYLPITVYEKFGDHIIYDTKLLNSHVFQFSKLILKAYFNIRIHHETNKIKDSVQERVRSSLTKAILFKNL